MREEIGALIRSGRLLVSDQKLSGTGFHFVSDPEAARALAFDQLPDSPGASLLPGQPMVWCDLRESAISELSNSEPFYCSVEELESLLFAYLPLEFEELLTEVACDLAFCIAASESEDPSLLAQRLWQAYESGLWPCGWAGDFPNGVLCVATAPKRVLVASASLKRKRYQQRKARQVFEAERA